MSSNGPRALSRCATGVGHHQQFAPWRPGARPNKRCCWLDDVIRETLLFLRHELQSRGAMVSHFPATAAPKVLADRTQLQQVIVNLVVNAMQAIAQDASAACSISTALPRMIPRPCTARSRTAAPTLHRSMSRACSRVFLRRRMAVWAWGRASAALSSRRVAGALRRTMSPNSAAPAFSSRCPLPAQSRNLCGCSTPAHTKV